MAFVRYKIVKGRKYYEYVRNYREGGKHKQEVLCYLGPYRSLRAAISNTQYMVQLYSDAAAEIEEEAESTKGYLLEFYGEELGGEIPSEDEAWEKQMRGELLPWSRVRLLPEYEQGPAEVKHRRQLQDLFSSIRDYHRARSYADLYKVLAEDYRAKLDKYTAVKQKYP